MISLFEFSYRYVIPSIKRRLVEKLIDMGMTQREVSKKLGLSASAVSRYLSMERGSAINVASFSDLDENIGKLALLIKDKNADHHTIQLAMYRIALYALSRKYMCEDHSKVDLSVNPKTCLICPALFGNLINL
jgi:predicted transcriptional regulator